VNGKEEIAQILYDKDNKELTRRGGSEYS